MIRRGLILFLILALPAQAEIYRWVDAEGRLHFSDRRTPGAERLEVQSGVADRPPPVLGPSSPDEPYPGPYAQVSLLAPVGDQTLNDPAEGVMVSLQLDPPLIEGHQLRLFAPRRSGALKPWRFPSPLASNVGSSSISIQRSCCSMAICA